MSSPTYSKHTDGPMQAPSLSPRKRTVNQLQTRAASGGVSMSVRPTRTGHCAGSETGTGYAGRSGPRSSRRTAWTRIERANVISRLSGAQLDRHLAAVACYRRPGCRSGQRRVDRDAVVVVGHRRTTDVNGPVGDPFREAVVRAAGCAPESGCRECRRWCGAATLLEQGPTVVGSGR